MKNNFPMNSQFPNLKIDCTFETRISSLSTFIGNLNTFVLKQIVLKLTIEIDKTRKLDWTFPSSDISQAKRVKEYANILIQITQTHTQTDRLKFERKIEENLFNPRLKSYRTVTFDILSWLIPWEFHAPNFVQLREKLSSLYSLNR